MSQRLRRRLKSFNSSDPTQSRLSIQAMGEPAKPNVQAWEGWPARQTNLIFGGMALGEKSYLDLWQKLEADPTDPEAQRNIGITRPLLWIK